MTLTASKFQTAYMLGVSEDTVENLLYQGKLRRTSGNRFVHIYLESIAEYTKMPLEFVLRECRLAPQRAQAITSRCRQTSVVDERALEPVGN
jgi:hypothetical protein